MLALEPRARTWVGSALICCWGNELVRPPSTFTQVAKEPKPGGASKSQRETHSNVGGAGRCAEAAPVISLLLLLLLLRSLFLLELPPCHDGLKTISKVPCTRLKVQYWCCQCEQGESRHFVEVTVGIVWARLGFPFLFSRQGSRKG